MAKSTTTSVSGSKKPLNDVLLAVSTAYKLYIDGLTPRLVLIDVFLAFLVALGVLQFVYVVLVGNFPFNAFLGGFILCVGQFVLTVSLRLQYINQSKKNEAVQAVKEVKEAEGDVEVEILTESNGGFSANISPERAFGDYIFASLLLHFIVLHFIN